MDDMPLFECHHCGKNFSWLNNLRRHKKKVHKDMSATSGADSQKKIKNMSGEEEESSVGQEESKPVSPVVVAKKDFPAVLSKVVTSTLVSHNIVDRPDGEYFMVGEGEVEEPKKKRARRGAPRSKARKVINNEKEKVKEKEEKVVGTAEKVVEDSPSTVVSTKRASLRRNIQRPKWLEDSDVASNEFPHRMRKGNEIPPSTSSLESVAKTPTALTEQKKDAGENQESDQGTVSPPLAPPLEEPEVDDDVTVLMEIKTTPKDESQKNIKKVAQKIVKKDVKRIVKKDDKKIAKKGAQKMVRKETQKIVEEEVQEIVDEGAQKIVEEEVQEIVEEDTQKIVEGEVKEIVEVDAEKIAEKQTKKIVRKGGLKIAKNNARKIVKKDGQKTIKKVAQAKLKSEKKAVKIRASKVSKTGPQQEGSPNVEPVAIEDNPQQMNVPASPTLALRAEILNLRLNEGEQLPPPNVAATPQKSSRKRPSNGTPRSSKGPGKKPKIKWISEEKDLESGSLSLGNSTQISVANAETETYSVKVKPDICFTFGSKGDMSEARFQPIPSISFLAEDETVSFADLANVTATTSKDDKSTAGESTAMESEEVDQKEDGQEEDVNNGRDLLNQTNDEKMEVRKPEASGSAAVNRSVSFSEFIENIYDDESTNTIQYIVPQDTPTGSGEATRAGTWLGFSAGGLPIMEGEEDTDMNLDRSDSLSISSCPSETLSEKIKALGESDASANEDKKKGDSSDDDGDLDQEFRPDLSSDSGDSILSEVNTLAEQMAKKTDGATIKAHCIHFLATKVSPDAMWRIRVELKRLKKDKDYFKFGKLTPLAAGLMHDVFCQSLK